jgi:hypothetical protein
MAGLLVVALAAPARASSGKTPDDAAGLLARIKAVGREGAGNAEAGRAWKELVRLGPGALPAILAALDGADPTAANWLRAAVDVIAERALAAHQPLPAGELERYIGDTRHSGAARCLAYEWLTRVDRTAPARLLPGMIQDPSVELRRDAVALAMKDGRRLLDQGDRAGAAAAYRRAWAGAADKDQVEAVARQLKGLGVEVDLPAHFGLVRRWHLAAPFDSTGGKGFARVYPPEKGVELSAVYCGKDGTEVRWLPYATPDPYGLTDLNKVLGKHKGAVAYAYTMIESPTRQQVQVRIGTPNALKLFVNGQEVFAREEYHHGLDLDQHVAHATLRAGRNELLLKLCQNEQSEAWAQNWMFQLRLCDAVGVAVLWAPLPLRGEIRNPKP